MDNGGALTHQGMGREAVFKPGVAKKQDLGPKLTAKKMRLAKIKDTRNSKVLMTSNITLQHTPHHVTLYHVTHIPLPPWCDFDVIHVCLQLMWDLQTLRKAILQNTTNQFEVSCIAGICTSHSQT